MRKLAKKIAAVSLCLSLCLGAGLAPSKSEAKTGMTSFGNNGNLTKKDFKYTYKMKKKKVGNFVKEVVANGTSNKSYRIFVNKGNGSGTATCKKTTVGKGISFTGKKSNLKA
ncbi:MAG: hypothetical protein K6G62_08380, partial [Eubacterium sp.]|nr:hypothetical protein [Eubacterium sp.]